MHSKLRSAYPCDKCYPCRQPKRFLDSGLLNPRQPKTICADNLCTNEVDMNEIRVCTTTASEVDVSCGITRVCGSVSAARGSCCRRDTAGGVSLITSSAVVGGVVLAHNMVLLAGPCVKNADGSHGPLLLSEECAQTVPDFWDLGPRDFCQGRTAVVLCGPRSSPSAIDISSSNGEASVDVKRFHDVASQQLDIVDDTSSLHTYVRASRGCNEWSAWRSLLAVV